MGIFFLCMGRGGWRRFGILGLGFEEGMEGIIYGVRSRSTGGRVWLFRGQWVMIKLPAGSTFYLFFFFFRFSACRVVSLCVRNTR